MKQKRTLWLTIFSCILCLHASSQGVGIARGEITPHPSAILELRTSSQGFLPPRLTAVQRLAIDAPAMGLVVYDNDSSTLMIYNGSAWKAIALSGNSLVLPFAKSVDPGFPTTAFSIINTHISETGVSSFAIKGEALGDYGIGIQGIGNKYGIYGLSHTPEAVGVFGENDGRDDESTGEVYSSRPGVKGQAFGPTGVGVYGIVFGSRGFRSTPVAVLGNAQGNGIGGYFSGTVGLEVHGAVKLPSVIDHVTEDRMVAIRPDGTLYNLPLPTGSGPVGGFYWTASGEDIINNNTGKVIINSSTPGPKLEVGGQVKITGGSPGLNKVLTSDENGLATWQFVPAGQWLLNGTHLYNSNPGNIGVGTNTPGALFHVYNDADIWHSFIGGNTGRLQFGGQTADGSVIQSWNPTDNVARDLYLQRDGGKVAIATTSNLPYRLLVRGGEMMGINVNADSLALLVHANTNKPAVIVDDGDVIFSSAASKLGIGVSSPQNKFHLVDKIRAFREATAKSSVYIERNPTIQTEFGAPVYAALEVRNSVLRSPVIIAKSTARVGDGLIVTAGTNGGTGVYATANGNGIGIYGLARGLGDGGTFNNYGGGNALHTLRGNVKFDTLSGVGTRMVIANETGIVGTLPIPAGLTLPYTGSGNTDGLGTFNIINNTDAGAAVSGVANSTIGSTIGVYGSFNSPSGSGVIGEALSFTGSGRGVQGSAYSPQGTGAYFFNWGGGLALRTAQGKVRFDTLQGLGTRMVVADDFGVIGTQPITGFTLPYAGTGSTDGLGTFNITNSNTSGAALRGIANSTEGSTIGVYGSFNSPSGSGVIGEALSPSGFGRGVQGGAYSPQGTGAYFFNWGGGLALRTTQGRVRFDTLQGTGTRMVVADEFGVLGTKPITGITLPFTGSGGIDGPGTFNITNNTDAGAAVSGIANSTEGSTIGVYGSFNSPSGGGVIGEALSPTGFGHGVQGGAYSPQGVGAYFFNWGGGLALRTTQGKVRFDTLQGVGTRMMVADEFGIIGTMPLPAGGAGQWLVNGEHIYNSNLGNVGIGLNNPGALLHVYKDEDVWHSFIGGNTGRLQIGGQTATGAVIQSWNPTDNVARDLYLQRDGGNVSVGTPGPVNYRFSVQGAAKQGIYAYSDSVAIYAASVANKPAIMVGSGNFSVANDRGMLGIGIANPQYRFHLVDNIAANRGPFSLTTALIDKKPRLTNEFGNLTSALEVRNGLVGGIGLKAVAYGSHGYGMVGISGVNSGYGARGEGRGRGDGTEGVAYGTGNGGDFISYGGGNALHTGNGQVTFDTLAGTGIRMVVADATGKLGTQDIPSGGGTPDNWGSQAVVTNTTLTGNGTAAQPLGLAAQGAATGQVLTYNGTTWAPANVTGGSFSLPYSGSTNTAYGLDITNTLATGTAVKGTATNGNAAGITGISSSTSGAGVRGAANATSGVNHGVEGTTQSYDGAGGYFSNLSGEGMALVTGQGRVWVNNLAGAGDRMVVADANGILRTEAIPSGGGTTQRIAFKASAGGVNNGLPQYDVFNKLPPMTFNDFPGIGIGYNYGGGLSDDGKAIFSAPVPGIYHFEVHLSFSVTDSCRTNYAIRLLRHGSQQTGGRRNGVLDFIHGYDIVEGELVRDLSLNAGETIEVEYMITTPARRPAGFNLVGGVAGDISSTFTGHLVTAVN